MRKGALTIVAVCFVLAAMYADAHVLPGGYKEVAVDSVDIKEAMEFTKQVRSERGILGAGKLVVCEAGTQVVSGLNVFLSFSYDCSSNNREDIQLYRGFDGKYSVTSSSF